ncbi:MAG TPA: MBL fold metallo-hydrolase, partial [Bacteroidales bacterium]|nr:MBL fold metallo-hydrolase [Bacteroidales bacterium]
MQIFNNHRFGQTPKGNRLERLKKSENYVNGEFNNLHKTPVFTPEENRFRVMMDFMFRKKDRLTPEYALPAVKTDINALDRDDDTLVWFGHSSYFMQLKGITFLVDPVFSDFASPFSFANKAFKGTNVYSYEDFPSIDFLIITHDHWDHLDYETIMNFKAKIQHVVCGLGVGQHFEYWGFDPSVITELDWYEGMTPAPGWRLTATPARHFSGRGLKRNKTLWVSYALQSPGYNLFLGGDGGYDTHFSDIGA